MKKIKYPRTPHLPWSEGVSHDDRIIKSLDDFKGKHVIVTEKMDGENTTFARTYLHARSLDSNNHPSRDWVKAFWGNIKQDLPEGWRVCGENLYAQHSVSYSELPSYFMGFSIWDERNVCLSWSETLEWFELLGITPVPQLYSGIFDVVQIKSIAIDPATQEGYVLRIAQSFFYPDFASSVAKYVRKEHVQTARHWMHQEVTPNRLSTAGKSFV